MLSSRSLMGLFATALISVSGVANAEVVSRDDSGATPLDAQPRMKVAAALLVKAKVELEKAEHDKGGHRANAIAHVKAALHEVKEGIAYDNAHPGSTPGTGDDAIALDAQPRMRAALALLRDAKAELEKAEHDKGGHRAKAISEVESAISEVKAGIGFDDAH